VKSYVRNTMNLSCAKILLTSVMDHEQDKVLLYSDEKYDITSI